MYQLLACGSNGLFQLGTGDDLDRDVLVPILIPNLPRPVQIACGGNHTLILTETNEVYAAGDNTYGQCGKKMEGKEIEDREEEENETNQKETENYEGGYTTNASATTTDDKKSGKSSVETSLTNGSSCSYFPTFTRVPGKWQAISCGWEFSVLVSMTGEVFTCGHGPKGELGLGSKTVSDLCSVGVTNAVSVKSALGHTIVKLEDGQFVGWGACRKGQLGTPDLKPNGKPVTGITVPRVLRFEGRDGLSEYAVGREFTILYSPTTYKIYGRNPEEKQKENEKKVQESDKNDERENKNDERENKNDERENENDERENKNGERENENDERENENDERNEKSKGNEELLSYDNRKIQNLTASCNIAEICTMWSSAHFVRGNTVTSVGNNSHGQHFPGNLKDGDILCTGSEHGLVLSQNVVGTWGWGEHGNCGQQTRAPPDNVVYDYINVLYEMRDEVVLIAAGCATSWVVVRKG